MPVLSRLVGRSFRPLSSGGVFRAASTAGVVRIVKPASSQDPQPLPQIDTESGSPLIGRIIPDSQKADRVSMDVRVADLFRQFQQNPDKSVVLSVLDNLSLMNIDGKILLKFPGFIQLIDRLGEHMQACQLSATEVVKVVGILSQMGLQTSDKFPSISAAFSNQVVSVLEAVSKPDLVKTLARLAGPMQMDLDPYMFWAVNKEMTRWALAANDTEFVKDVLGPLQAFAQAPLVDYMSELLSNLAIENRIVSLIGAQKLNSHQLVELIMNLPQYPHMAQTGIIHILASHKDKLRANLTDLAVLISALPSDPLTRNADVQTQLSELLLAHLRQPASSDSSRIKATLSSVANLVIDVHNETEAAILREASALITDNAQIVNKLKPDAVANLFYVYAMGSVSLPADRAGFKEICGQIESVAVGRLPQLSAPQISKLSLAFASGMIKHPNSFKALSALFRRRAAEFPPADFVDACYGLAYRGLLSKAALVEGNVDQVAEAVPVSALPKLAWSVAVADYSLASIWETLIKRLDSEILSKPSALEALSKADEAMLYEVLAAVKFNQFTHLSPSAERRMKQFQLTWTPPVKRSEIDYHKLLEIAGLTSRADVLSSAAMVQLPIYIPEYKLVLDVTKEPIAAAGGMTNGSVKLRHSIWSKMGYNVIGISDSQFDGVASETERAALLGTIIGQFVSEVSAVANPVREESRKPVQWSSRKEQSGRSAEDQWESRSESKKTSRASAPTSSGWASRQEDASA